mmetsp:Transcript_399/g.1171  ORF Transcript_399/g.1171 Transcript_399/m.1171 type:complete len:234 (-) Transcript_399:2231-2932(-)
MRRSRSDKSLLKPRLMAFCEPNGGREAPPNVPPPMLAPPRVAPPKPLNPCRGCCCCATGDPPIVLLYACCCIVAPITVAEGGASPSESCVSTCCCGSMVLTLGSDTTDWMSGLTSTRAGTSVAASGTVEGSVAKGLGTGAIGLVAMAGGDALVDEGTEAGVAVALLVAVGAGVNAAFTGEDNDGFAGVFVLAEKGARAGAGAGAGLGTAAGTCFFTSGFDSSFIAKSPAWPYS